MPKAECASQFREPSWIKSSVVAEASLLIWPETELRPEEDFGAIRRFGQDGFPETKADVSEKRLHLRVCLRAPRGEAGRENR